MTEPAHAEGLPEEEPEVVELLDSGHALTAINRAEIDIQISTAKRYPRSIQQFKAQARTLATLDEETAGSMFYALPREGRTIDGPSIRFAEIVGSSWKNLRYGARIVAVDEKHVTAQGACFDLENNLACTVEAKRRITDKRGRRYSDDMVTVTSQAAMSIALRNAIFRVVPFGLVKDIYEEARAASIGKGKTMAQRRQSAVDIFSKWGVAPDKMCQLAGKTSLDDLDDEALIKLRGFVTAIRDGETSIDEVLREAGAVPTVVTPETLGGLKPEDISKGAVTGQDAPLTEPSPETAKSVAIRLQEIKEEQEKRGVKQAVVDHLMGKHLGTTDMTTVPHDEETFAKLSKVLAELRWISLAKK